MLRGVAAPRAVLVAEDEPQLLRLVSRVLERAGYEVLPAADGEAALEAVAAHGERIDTAVLDAAISPRGCDEIVAALRRQQPGVGLVVASGGALDGGLRRLAREGGVFLRKPFALASLLRAVADARGA